MVFEPVFVYSEAVENGSWWMQVAACILSDVASNISKRCADMYNL
jgi:hypothetical protein